MNATQINEALADLKQTIYSEIHHRILLKYIDEPILNDEQLFFMLLPFLAGESYTEEMKKDVTAVAIVHASLQEHEKIKELNDSNKVQQLTVLSGDFYSGIYYELLAQKGNIHLIHALSSGIISRCEQQMVMYEKEQLTLEDFLQFIEVIESELIVKFYDVYNYRHFEQLAKQTLTIVKLKQMLAGEFVYNEFASNKEWLALVETRTEIEQELNARIEKLKTLLHTTSLPDEVKKAIETYYLS